LNLYLEATRLAHFCVRVQFPAIKKIIWYIFNIRVGSRLRVLRYRLSSQIFSQTRIFTDFFFKFHRETIVERWAGGGAQRPVLHVLHAASSKPTSCYYTSCYAELVAKFGGMGGYKFRDGVAKLGGMVTSVMIVQG
jgi:hypothetical protein